MHEVGVMPVGWIRVRDLVDRGCVGLLLFALTFQRFDYRAKERSVVYLNKVVVHAFLVVRIRYATLFPSADQGGEGRRWSAACSSLLEDGGMVC
jgi:hypothetical protein